MSSHKMLMLDLFGISSDTLREWRRAVRRAAPDIVSISTALILQSGVCPFSRTCSTYTLHSGLKSFLSSPAACFHWTLQLLN